MRLGCLLSLFVPYQLASALLGQFSGLQVSASSLWHWVEQQGRRAKDELAAQLAAQEAGEPIAAEALAAAVAGLPLAIAADGVMVPMRPLAKSPKGKTVWQEVKVAVLARLGQRFKRSGEAVPALVQRRLVAVLGSVEQFIPALQLEAKRQSFESAPQVVWLSDGGKGFWGVYQRCFSHCAVAVLDFYHAAGQLWQAASALSDSHSVRIKWFKRWRHALRHGHHASVLTALTLLVNHDLLGEGDLKTMLRVQAYFQRHHRHIRYRHFEKLGLPLGSGMVESACKWLIQQRFKGVGMRWSQDGFNHLLILRLAWVNQRFDDLFPLVPPVEQAHSHDT